jgi:hypothetical protein
VAEIIDRMLARRRDDRYQDAESLLRDVKAVWRSSAASPSPVASPNRPSVHSAAAAPAAGIEQACPYCGITASPALFDRRRYCANCGRERPDHPDPVPPPECAPSPAIGVCPRCGSEGPPHRIGENAYCDNCGVEIAKI